MEPTIKKGEFVVLDSNAYASATPRRWDIIVFKPPQRRQLWCARVVGLPGETIDLRPEGVFINGAHTLMPPELHGISYEASVWGTASIVTFPFVISSDCFFALGDNTANAYDSRFWGELPAKNIEGRVRRR